MLQRRTRQCCVKQHCSSLSSSFSSSPGHSTGEDKHFVFFFCFSPLSLSLPPLVRALSKPKRTQPTPPYDEKTKGVVPCKRLLIGHFAQHQDSVGWPRSPVLWWDRDRVDLAPPAPINIARKEHWSGGGRTRKKKE